MKRAVALALGLAAAITAGEAAADPLEFSAGVATQLGLEGLGSPSPSSYELPQSGLTVREPSYSGFSYGAGVSLELRLLGRLALGVEALAMRDRLAGDVQVGDSDVAVSIAGTAIHVPVYLKGILPLPLLAPYALLGIEHVIPTLSDAESDPSDRFGVVASAESHTHLLLGLGVELDLLDSLRPHAALRVGYRPGGSDDLEDRVTVLPTDAVVYDATHRYQVMLALGAAYVF